MPRPSNPDLALYWDRARLKLPSDDDTDQHMVEYAARRMKALDRDNTNRAQGVLPAHEYQSRIAKSREVRSERCEFRDSAGRRCLSRSNHQSEHRA